MTLAIAATIALLQAAAPGQDPQPTSAQVLDEAIRFNRYLLRLDDVKPDKKYLAALSDDHAKRLRGITKRSRARVSGENVNKLLAQYQKSRLEEMLGLGGEPVAEVAGPVLRELQKGLGGKQDDSTPADVLRRLGEAEGDTLKEIGKLASSEGAQAAGVAACIAANVAAPVCFAAAAVLSKILSLGSESQQVFTKLEGSFPSGADITDPDAEKAAKALERLFNSKVRGSPTPAAVGQFVKGVGDLAKEFKIAPCQELFGSETDKFVKMCPGAVAYLNSYGIKTPEFEKLRSKAQPLVDLYFGAASR